MRYKLSFNGIFKSTVLRGPLLLVLVYLVLLFAWSTNNNVHAEDALKIEFFENRIRPVLVEHCYECHSSESKGLKGGLLVDSADGLLLGGDSGPAIEAGDSEASLLMQAIRYESMEMPPRGKLPDAVIEDFATWIESGATDPRVSKQPLEKASLDIQQFRDFWSFVPPKTPPLPEVSNSNWPVNQIDHFILAALEQKGLSPVGDAERRDLIRRATFDLTGLPPTPAEVESFLVDDDPKAFEKVVDRLLRSPAYGERWGRYWLDVARYSEDQAHTFSVKPNTNGFRYRDWVISAFNNDMPYNLLVKRQIAADLMATNEDERLKHLPALGYFGLGAQYYKNSDAAKAAADELDDRVDTLTRGFLGLTVSCARCHDHKFDPIPQQDYYSLAGVFQSSRLSNAPLVSQDEVQEYKQEQEQIEKVEQQIAQTIAAEGLRIREAGVNLISSYMLAAWKLSLLDNKKFREAITEESARAQLDPAILNRWIDFLKSDDAKAIPSLASWFNSIAEAKSASDVATTNLQSKVRATIKQAADQFQRFATLLLLDRNQELSSDEKQELAKYVDPGNAIYQSPILTKDYPADTIDIDITGSNQLYLVVSDGGNGISCDHASWAEPILVFENGEEKKLTDLKWRETKTSYGKVNVDKNITGNAIRIGGTAYSFGLGTHAISMIAYDLPEGVSRFRTIAGLDNSGSDQGGCGANARIQFHIYTQAPSDIEVNQPDILDKLFGEKGLFAISEKELEKQLPVERANLLAEQREHLKQLTDSARPMYPIAHVIAESKPADMSVFIRGNPANKGEVAPRRFLRILCDQEPTKFEFGSGRLELANAVASEQNPLTARVMVNRVWQHHFGRGIVGTPDNFGQLGERPTHPELLDYLTDRFMSNGWSLKSLHREIMSSRTYQLASEPNAANMEIDADNQFLWRMNRRRLEIEAWRDALLAVSGRLDPRMQGPSTNLSEKGNSRRTVYAFISRHELNNMLRLFDFPDANITASKRTETTVPQQQLFVLNSPFMIEQAKAFAKRLREETSGDLNEMIQYAFELAYGRPVTIREKELAIRYLTASDAQSDSEFNSLTRLERYAQVILGANEFMYLD